MPLPRFNLSIFRLFFHRKNTSSIYLFQNSGLITLGAQRLFMCSFHYRKVLIVTHAKTFFSRVFWHGFASSDYCLRSKIQSISPHTRKILWWPGYGSIELNIWFSILAMKIWAKATATFVTMAVPWVCRYLLPQDWNKFPVHDIT